MEKHNPLQETNMGIDNQGKLDEEEYYEEPYESEEELAASEGFYIDDDGHWCSMSDEQRFAYWEMKMQDEDDFDYDFPTSVQVDDDIRNKGIVL